MSEIKEKPGRFFGNLQPTWVTMHLEKAKCLKEVASKFFDEHSNCGRECRSSVWVDKSFWHHYTRCSVDQNSGPIVGHSQLVNTVVDDVSTGM